MGTAHGKANIGLGQGRGIVHAVTHHGGGAAGLQVGQQAQFVLGQQAALGVRNARLGSTAWAVAGWSPLNRCTCSPQGMQLGDGGGGFGAQGVGHGKPGQYLLRCRPAG